MPLTTFNPPVNPTPPSGRRVKPRVLTAGFGDGYEQRALDGLNPIQEERNETWRHLTETEAQAIESFFDSLQGVSAFKWTPPESTLSKAYKAPEWEVRKDAPGVFTVRAKLVRVYELD